MDTHPGGVTLLFIVAVLLNGGKLLKFAPNYGTCSNDLIFAEKEIM